MNQHVTAWLNVDLGLTAVQLAPIPPDQGATC